MSTLHNKSLWQFVEIYIIKVIVNTKSRYNILISNGIDEFEPKKEEETETDSQSETETTEA